MSFCHKWREQMFFILRFFLLEIISRTIMLAGHDSTASSLSWLFLDLARNPEDQQRIREEIAAIRERSLTPEALSIADFDAMTFTNAVIKVKPSISAEVPRS
jgi:Cytochrome P450